LGNTVAPVADRPRRRLRAHAVGEAPIDLAAVRQAVAVLADPSHGFELRGLPSGRSCIRPGADVKAIAKAAELLAEDRGIYYTLNPTRAKPDRATQAGDVCSRRWLLVDIDPAKPADHKDNPSTDNEHKLAHRTALTVRGYLTDLGWPLPLLVDSGNGWHLLYRIALPNDKPSGALFKTILHALADRFDGPDGTIDRTVHNASRIARLPGTKNRKGTASPERPHRWCRLVECPVLEVVTAEALQTAAAQLATSPPSTPAHQPPAPAAPRGLKAKALGTGDAWARSALQQELGKVAMAQPGQRNHQLNASAFALGQIVAGGGLSREPVEAALHEAAVRSGLDRDEGCGTAGIEATIKSGLDAGAAEPRQAPERNGKAPHGPGGPISGKAIDVATVEDLAMIGSVLNWVWPGWIQLGVVNALAAPGGMGKTRFMADLQRRILHGLGWPDGARIEMPRDSLALWVLADNHHDEIVSLAHAFDIAPAIRINASKADPYGGVSLETEEDYNLLEARVSAVRPAFVIIDTVGNATDLNLSRQEDAKAFYQPLQLLARRYRTAVICLTHLNADGQFLGRRILEKVRVAVKMDRPDPESDRRRLEVVKSNSKRPSPLGVTMTDTGNEYDDRPPEPASEGSGIPSKTGPSPDQLQTAQAFLQRALANGQRRVTDVRSEADAAGITAPTLYRAKRQLQLVEFQLTTDNYKRWRLSTEDDEATL
jgi:hypothetical protein